MALASTSYILVTGGCGYIGSHAVVELLRRTEVNVVVLDNLSNSHTAALAAMAEAGGRDFKFVEADLCDTQQLRAALARYGRFDAVLHFAASKSVPESMASPIAYYENNVAGMINLLAWSRERRVRGFVFSSSCIVYGDEAPLPVTEASGFGVPRSPYGHTKQLGERLLTLATDMRCVALRYFNPAGADASGLLGDSGDSDYVGLTRVLCRAALEGRPVMVFGDDYPTPDGTCVRDYVHVSDVAEAHVAALRWALRDAAPALEYINLGSERGYTVREAIAAFERASGQTLRKQVAPRREGDLAASYGDCSRAKQLFGWEAHRSLDEVMGSAWRWASRPRVEAAASAAPHASF